MFANTAADVTYRFPLNFCVKELARYFEVILAHMWGTHWQRHQSLCPIYATLAVKGLKSDSAVNTF